MKVLYVERTGLIGGGERSLLGLLDGLPADCRPLLASPEGPLHEAARARRARAAAIHETVGSFKLHPVHTPRAVADMARGSVGVLAAAHRFGADLVHANSIRAGLLAIPAAALLNLPLVVHVRDRMPPSPVSSAIRAVLLARADAILAISEWTARELDPSGTASTVRIVDNPLDTERFEPAHVDRAGARAALGVSDDSPLLALVGQITPWKGQEEAIRALADVRRRFPGAQLLVIGEAKFVAAATRYDNVAYLATLRELAAELGLADAVRFLGEREDIPELLGASDLALVPSWEEPFGRTVVEAMAMGLPVMATDVGGPTEVITDGHDGRLLPPRDPARWGAVALELLEAPEARSAMGARARETVTHRFGLARHAAAVSAVYRELLG